MAVSMMSRGLGVGVVAPRRVRAQPVSKSPFTMSVVRPTAARAFYNRKCGSGYGNWGGYKFNMRDEDMQRMAQEFEDMAKQWRETGKVGGGFFWPGGGYVYGAARNNNNRDNASSSSSSTSNNSGSFDPSSLPLDVVSTEGFYLLYADVPGLAKSDLSIKLSKERVLTLSGQRSAPVEEGFQQKERGFGAFSRSWNLPEDADSEGISAKVTEGVLTITVPKKQPEPEVDDAQDITIN